MAEKHCTCARCGAGFVAHHKRLHCSRSCYEADRYSTRNQRATKARPETKCQHCGKSFVPKESNRATYCSRSCSFKAKAARSAERIADVAPFSKVHCNTCVVCGRQRWASTAKKTCSPACNLEHRRRQAADKFKSATVHEVRACEVCGQPFTTANRKQVICSRRCSRDKYGRNHSTRARRYGVTYEPVNVVRVFERDGWRCQICGKPTPQLRRGTRHPNAPELDHRVPMSKGGEHSYANTQCACRQCNIKKGNRSDAGQMPMFQ